MLIIGRVEIYTWEVQGKKSLSEHSHLCAVHLCKQTDPSAPFPHFLEGLSPPLLALETSSDCYPEAEASHLCPLVLTLCDETMFIESQPSPLSGMSGFIPSE